MDFYKFSDCKECPLRRPFLRLSDSNNPSCLLRRIISIKTWTIVRMHPIIPKTIKNRPVFYSFRDEIGNQKLQTLVKSQVEKWRQLEYVIFLPDKTLDFQRVDGVFCHVLWNTPEYIPQKKIIPSSFWESQDPEYRTVFLVLLSRKLQLDFG